MRTIERIGYWVGAALLVSGVGHVAILLATGGSWEGPVSLRKPAVFGLSFGVTLINVTVLASVLSMPDRVRTLLIGGMAAASVFETALVSMQAWRGVPSHFNMQTRFDAGVAQLLAIGGAALVAIIIALTVAAFGRQPTMPPLLRTAIRGGLLTLIGAQVTGGVMIAFGVRELNAGRPDIAFATAGWLKPLHAVLMHGVFVLPLLAWWISRTGWTERAQRSMLRAGVLIYAVAVGGAVAVSIFG